MAGLTLKNVEKIYPGGSVAVKNFTLEIDDGDFAVLAGPAESGKSTVLRMIGGLEDISGGSIYIDGIRVDDLEPRERDVAMLFRNYIMFPQMNVYENLAFGLKLGGCPKEEMDERVRETAKLLNLADILDKMPDEITELEKHRVAVGRAVARRPKVFLLDDPMSHLDKDSALCMRRGLMNIHKKLGTTIVYVTENAEEALAMATKIAVIRDGALEQTGIPSEILEHPANRFVAEYFGSPVVDFNEDFEEEEA